MLTVQATKLTPKGPSVPSDPRPGAREYPPAVLNGGEVEAVTRFGNTLPRSVCSLYMIVAWCGEDCHTLLEHHTPTYYYY